MTLEEGPPLRLCADCSTTASNRPASVAQAAGWNQQMRAPPIVANANLEAYSVRYYVASAADERWVTPAGMVGSIGVRSMHVDWGRWNEQQGPGVPLGRGVGGVEPRLLGFAREGPA